MATNEFPGIVKKTQGKDFAYYKKIIVDNATFGGQSVDGYQPTGIITFKTTGFMIFNETAGSVVEFSVNGNTTHGELNGDNATAGLSFDRRVVSLYWLRLASGPAATVHVYGWCD